MSARCSLSVKIIDVLSIGGESENRGVLMSFKAEHTNSFPGKEKVRRWHVSPQWTEAQTTSGACHFAYRLNALTPSGCPVITTEGILISLVRGVIAFPPHPLSLTFGFWAVLETERQVLIASVTQPFRDLLYFQWNWSFRSEMSLPRNFSIGPLLKGKAAYGGLPRELRKERNQFFGSFTILGQNSYSFAVLFWMPLPISNKYGASKILYFWCHLGHFSS